MLTKLFHRIIFICVFLLAIGFAAVNEKKVSLDYLFGEVEVYFSLALFFALFLGAMLSAIICYVGFFLGIKRENSQLKREIHKIRQQQQESDLRAVPIIKE